MLHFRFYLFGKFELVGCLFGTDGQIDGVQPVDTVITPGRLFLAGDFQQLVQADQLAVFVQDGDERRVESVFFIFRNQGETYPLAALPAFARSGQLGFHIPGP